jgi:CheY-like chemotaxis protein
MGHRYEPEKLETAARILIVDDHEDNVELLRARLESWGYETVSAKDGVEALNTIESTLPDLVLLDIMMPVMDGWAFLEELQTIPATERPRVIVVSARSSLRDRAKAAELGADAFVAKPFSVDDLMVVLHDIEQAV